MSPHDLNQYFKDKQWVENYQELFRLAYRRLAPYLSPREQETFWSQLHADHDESIDHQEDGTPTTESDIAHIYNRFEVNTLYQLVRYAVFTSEEEIKIYVES